MLSGRKLSGRNLCLVIFMATMWSLPDWCCVRLECWKLFAPYRKLCDDLGGQSYASRQTLLFICFLHFFVWVSPRSVLLSGFLFRILNILNKFLRRHSFDHNKLLGQRTCFDDCSDVWVGPARPSLLGPEDARWQKLCVLFFFCAYKMHTFASMGTLLLSCDTLASTWHFSLHLSFLWVRLLWWHLRMLEAQDPLAIFLAL